MLGWVVAAEVTWAMYTFHGRPGSPVSLGEAGPAAPYQTTSMIPGPPAAIHGMTLVSDGGRFRTRGFDHVFQSSAADAHEYRISKSSSCVQATYRLRAVSSATTGNSSPGLPLSVSV